MKKTTIYLPDELAISVKAAAKRTKTSEASLIREAVATYVATLDRPRPKSIGAGSFDFDARETEDWLLENWKPE